MLADRRDTLRSVVEPQLGLHKPSSNGPLSIRTPQLAVRPKGGDQLGENHHGGGVRVGHLGALGLRTATIRALPTRQNHRI
jgi:hypothetical protein